jgi:hypothetical protein
MRLLKLNDNGRFSLTKFANDKIPEYAILSHTWARGDMEEDEVIFKDIMDDANDHRTKKGFQKLIFCATQAWNDGLSYF